MSLILEPYLRKVVISFTLSDKLLLHGASTFLDFKHSSHHNTPEPKHTKTFPIDNRYYPSGYYIPYDFLGTTPWTPLLCFPQNSVPYVIRSMQYAY